MTPADDDLLATVQAMVETQQQMLRRQLATEQVFREVRDKVTQAVDVVSDVKLLRYRLDTLTPQVERQRIQLLVAFLTILILLLALGIPLAIVALR
jgi:hypothetical protein